MNPRYSNLFLAIAFLFAITAVLLVNNHETKNFAGEAFRAGGFTNPTSYERNTYEPESTYEKPLPTDLDGLTNVLRTQSTSDLEEAAIKRKEQLTELANENPEEYLRYALSSYERSQLPWNVREHIEQERTIKGTVIPVVREKDGSAEYEYLVQTDQETLYLRNSNLKPNNAGAQVQASGYALDEQLVIKDSYKQLITQEPTTQQPSSTEKILLIPATYRDTSRNGVTQQDIKSVANRAEDYFAKVSYGKFTPQITIADWKQLPQNQPGDCDPWKSNLPWNQDGYDYVAVLLSISCAQEYDGYGTIGKVNGEGRSLTLYTDSDEFEPYQRAPPKESAQLSSVGSTLVHEIGHNLGLHHASSYTCSAGTLEGFCTSREYGSSFDVMGDPVYATHFNAHSKEQLGWLGSSDIITISEPGTYTLRPLEHTRGVRAAKILLSGDGAYYLEYRQPLNFDKEIDNLNIQRLLDEPIQKLSQGLKVTWVSDAYAGKTQLLDLSPNDPLLDKYLSFLFAPEWSGPDYFHDENNNVAIGPITQQDENAISFRVRHSPDIQLDLIRKPGGGTLSWQVTPTSADCTASGDWSGTKPAAGLQHVSMTRWTQEFRLSCTHNGLRTTNRVTLDGY